MAKRDRLITKKVNFYDGHRITERDLDDEQIHNNALASNITVDFHGSGVVEESPFEDLVLLDTRSPGLYAATSGNLSKLDIESGTFDGKGIALDRQPNDPVYGTRVEFELVNSDVKGRKKTKLMVIGRAFDGANSQGELVAEFIDFSENGKKVSAHYYISIISVFFNNFSGGLGKTENAASKQSFNLISEREGYIIIREAPPLYVYPATKTSFQVESPNFDMINYITSSVSRSISDEIALALGAFNNINDIYIDLVGKEKVLFEKNGATSISYGQKFLSEVDNLQKIDLLLSVDRDTSLPIDNQFDFSGDIVIGVYELVSELACSTDVVPDDLIDFDPEITPMVEISFGQEDLEALGYKLNGTPQVVSFNFAGTLIADPNISPSIKPDTYYGFIVSRRGDNRTGTVVLEKGFDKVSKKADDGTPLTVIERFGKQKSKYLEYDPNTKRFINDSSSSLWYSIHSDTVEVTSGTAYTDFGVAVTVPKTVGFVGSTEISKFERNINLRTVAEGSSNYLILSQQENFSDAGIHPRTNNFVFTRILDSASISMSNSSELANIEEDTVPVILAKITDRNVRDATNISGIFDKPGLIGTNTIRIVSPGNNILTSNLINRIITPDTDCNCNSRYRITRVDCEIVKAGDLNKDRSLTSSDLSLLLNIIGNTINSEATERSILGGELDIIDFIKSDLNQDGTLDGTDIELLEQAIDGYANFDIAEEFRVLTLQLENVLEDSDNPIIFTDTLSSGITTASSALIEFVTATENQALIIRPGDIILVPSPSSDAGSYTVASKEVAIDGVTVTVTVLDEDGLSPVFTGDVSLNLSIISGTEVNLYADNPVLASVPFVPANYQIDFIEAPFEDTFLEICDLRRFVGSSFLEKEVSDNCGCEEVDCLPAEVCSPVYKNQTYVPGDIYIPNGEILAAPGVPHHGDFEFVNIKLPLPAGSITGCSLDLYNSFIKAESGSCLTSAGFPAMKYSDGSLVGCEDVGSNTDIRKGRVKLAHAVCSIYVDALVDGYVDGYTEANQGINISDSVEAISENYEDNSYASFNTWIDNALNDITITNITNPSGISEPAIFDLTTSSNSGERFGRLDGPAAIQGFAGDFIVDFKASRTTWSSSSITNGTVSSFATLVISNTDGSTATLKLGWKSVGANPTKMFYSGVIENSLSVVVSTFNYEINAPDIVGELVSFRFRRINDVVSAYYIIPGRLDESTLTSFGQYVKIGTNPDMQPGSGTVDMSFEVNQVNSPTPGATFFVRLTGVEVFSDYSSDDELASIQIGKVNATSIVDRAIITLPFSLPRRTTVLSAIMRFTSDTTASITDSVRIIPVDLLNADNLGRISNFPLETNVASMVDFVPGSIVSGQTFEVDITDIFISLLSQVGHLPGFLKGFLVEPDDASDSQFAISSLVEIETIYEDQSTGIVFQVGVTMDQNTGIVTFNTKNILFDALVDANRTVVNFGVYLKKAGFRNQDLNLSVTDLSRLGIGTCFDQQVFVVDGECYYIVGSTGNGTFVDGPFPCPE